MARLMKRAETTEGAHPTIANRVARDNRFIALWGQHKTYAEICTDLGISHSRVHEWRERLNLPRRQAAPGEGAKKPPVPRIVAPAPIVVAPPLPPRVPRPMARNGCQYPLWPDNARVPMPPLFCGIPSEPGRSYCEAHCRVCFAGYVTAARAERMRAQIAEAIR